MAKGSEEAFVAMLNREINRAMQAPVVEIHARLLGYEMALAAIIAALDKTGALPIAGARSAIDAAETAVAEDAPNAPIRSVLRQLSARLAPPAPPPARH
jgi:hypothetical protein